MCNPVAVVMGVGAVLAAYSKYEESQAEAAQLNQQARLQETQAGDARLRGQAQAGMAKLEGSQMIETQEVQFSSAGVDPNVGTPVDVYGATRAVSEIQVADIENQAAREAWGMEQSATMSKYAARLKKQTGNVAIATSLIGGAASAAYAYGAGPTLATTAGGFHQPSTPGWDPRVEF